MLGHNGAVVKSRPLLQSSSDGESGDRRKEPGKRKGISLIHGRDRECLSRLRMIEIAKVEVSSDHAAAAVMTAALCAASLALGLGSAAAFELTKHSPTPHSTAPDPQKVGSAPRSATWPSTRNRHISSRSAPAGVAMEQVQHKWTAVPFSDPALGGSTTVSPGVTVIGRVRVAVDDLSCGHERPHIRLESAPVRPRQHLGLQSRRQRRRRQLSPEKRHPGTVRRRPDQRRSLDRPGRHPAAARALHAERGDQRRAHHVRHGSRPLRRGGRLRGQSLRPRTDIFRRILGYREVRRRQSAQARSA